jgi:signal peptidase I
MKTNLQINELKSTFFVDILKQNIPIRLKTRGSSMLPFIRSGDYITIRYIRWEELKIGDIIAYSDNGYNNITCHRLVKIEGSILITKGDSHNQGYERILPNSLLGKLISIEHGRNKLNLEAGFQRFLAFKVAWISLYLPILLLIINYFIKALSAPHLVPIKIIRKIKRKI